MMMEERRRGTEERPTIESDGTRIFLQPIAAPAILGLYALATASLLIGANYAGWYGENIGDQVFVLPFAAIFGGLAQLLAGMWAYRARDGLGTAIHAAWGSFFVAYSLLFLLNAQGTITIPVTGEFTELGWWFVPLGAISLTAMLIAYRVNLALVALLGALTVSSGLAAGAFFTGEGWALEGAGYAFVISAAAAWYEATGLMVEPLLGREIPPLFELVRRPSVDTGIGEPGVIKGEFPTLRFSEPVHAERRMSN